MLIKKKRRRRLTLELILMTIVSLAVGALAGRLVENTGVSLLIHKLDRENYYASQEKACIESLNAFIRENQVTADNMELLFAWVQDEKNAYVMFYRDVDALFDPYLALEGAEPGGLDTKEYYDVTLMDGTKIKAEMEFYLDGKYFYAINAAGYAIGGIVFVLILFILIHRKIRYVHRLEQDLKILGSGNLEYSMTMRGNDELTILAEGIENLKNSILDQQLMKDEAEKANAELVTAMSHDLRTPLTSLIGYLELLTMHRYADEAQLHSYLEHCREKAFQMKKMSDRLFEYFLVYGKREQNYQFHMIDCEALLEELCNSQFFDWQEQGGSLECRVGELKGKLMVDSEYLQRVLDNLLSNLRKYGDMDYPLEIDASEQGDMLKIRIQNHVLKREDKKESTQIGLRTCRKIMEEHKGTFTWEQEGELFRVEIMLPLKK